MSAGPTDVCLDCQPDKSQDTANTLPPTATIAQNALDPNTFIPPSTSSAPSITIEFCDRCRWLHRATWVSTELFLTFPTPAIKSITVMPLNAEDTGGRFRVWLYLDGQPPILVWDRKVEGGFPELKVLKQRIRDHIQPGKSLGHSDK
ncbi:Rdx family-domain-containing protein [Trametes meyenii]|nr:Rdx family-domain-containing protein [Trametes meyenii]